MSEYDESVKEYWKISYGKYFVEIFVDKVLEDEGKKLSTMPLHLGAIVLSNSKKDYG